VEDLDGEVLVLLTEDLLGLLLEDLAGPVMGVDDVVADYELDQFRLDGDLEVLDLLFGYFGNDSLLFCTRDVSGGRADLCLQIAIHEVDLL
jgi:hypothetical protein